MPSDVSPEQAIALVREKFPIKGYMSDVEYGFLMLSRTIRKYLPRGARIIDFGSGPCLKTAIIQLQGYRCSAYDDLQDPWHLLPGMRQRLCDFAREMQIDFHCDPPWDFGREQYDMAMSLHTLEHFADSPRDLLNDLIQAIKPGGYLFLMMPNIANIRKRLSLLLTGKTVMESFGRYYWSAGPWRGHHREYARDELVQLARYLDLEICELHGCNDALGRLPGFLRPLYIAAMTFFPNARDTWLFVGRKRPGWKPRREPPPEFEHFLVKKNVMSD